MAVARTVIEVELMAKFLDIPAQRRRFTLPLLLLLSLVGSLLAPAAVSAQQQNEIVLTVDFDGTAAFSAADPLDDGLGAHTPGLDLNANNNVVRTYDQIQYRIDWNVNEVDGTTTTIRMTLPEGMEWLPDATTASGVPSGCLDDGSSSITGNGGRDLVCNTDAEHEGSNGAIHPRAFVNGFLDGTPLTVDASVETDQLPPVVSNSVTTEVSASPGGNWIKGAPILDEVSGDVIGYEPDETYFSVPGDSGETGRLFVWNIRLEPAGGLKGSEPLNDAIPLEFWDHFFASTPSAALATPAQMLAATGLPRVNCGGYDGDGGYPFGVTAGLSSTTPAAQTNIGNIACTDLGNSAGYPQVKFDITGHDTQNIAPQNADGSANASTLISAQVAFWAPESELSLLPSPGVIVNAITGSPAPVTAGTSEVPPILVHGTNDPVPEISETGSGLAGISNNAPYQLVPEVTGNPGRSVRHSIQYLNGPYQEIETTDAAGDTWRIYDNRLTGLGGTGRTITNGSAPGNATGVNTANALWSGDGQTPRGNILTVYSSTQTVTSRDVGLPFSAPIHSCIAVDTTHQEVIGMPATFPLLTGTADPALRPDQQTYFHATPTTGGSAVAPSTPIANVVAHNTGGAFITWANSAGATVGTSSPELDWILEVASVGDQGNAAPINTISCNEADGNWVDASTGDLSQFQTDTLADGTPVYGGVTHFRVRTAGDVPWSSDNFASNGTTSYGSRINLGFQVRVKEDPAIHEAGQELFVYQSRAWGEWDGTGQPPTERCTSNPRFGPDELAPPLGWCNLGFQDDGADTLDVGDFNNDYDGSAIEISTSGFPRAAHADVVFIVDAQLGISKVNTAGLGDIVANGDTVEFEINPRVTGSSLDSIANVTVTDALPANMVFAGFTSQPAGSPCAHAGGVITCNYGTQSGGWGSLGEGRFSFNVTIVDAGADQTLTNTATVSGDDSLTGAPKNPASSSAQAFTGAPFEESGIEKAVDEHITDCFEAPGTIHDAGDCTVIAVDGGLIFTLDIENEGNVDLDDYRVVDVLPFNGDATEPPSAPHPFTGVALTGDGRTPPSNFSGSLDFVAALPPAGSVILYSADNPATISRDPGVAESGVTTWCSAPAGGTAVAAGLGAAAGTGACPASAADVTAIHVDLGTLDKGATEFIEIQLTTVGAECGNIWTNNFGARTTGLFLPIRSNDVSVMAGFCEPSIDIEKSTNGLDSDTPDGAQLVVGEPVTWTYDVTNDGDVALANATVIDTPAPAGGIVCDVDGDGIFESGATIPLILPGQTITCEATGIATAGPFSNNASIEGTPVLPDFSDPAVDPADPSTWPTDAASYEGPVDPITGEPVLENPSDEDPSHYTGVELDPAIDIEKDTNGAQSDVAPGETLVVGEAVTWTYVVENTGVNALLDAEVTDVGSDGVPIVVDCDIDGDGVFGDGNIIPLLLPTEAVTCQSTGIAGPGPYSNNATVTGDAALPNEACVCDPTDPSTWPANPASFDAYVDPTTGEPVEVDAEDPSHYTGVEPGIGLEKSTNGVDSDEAPGETILEGAPITWTYEVTNTGGTALLDAVVTDTPAPAGGIVCDIAGDGSFSGTNVIPFLAVGESVTCQATGIATPGPFTNNASVGGTPALPDFATCGCDPADPSTWPTDPAAFAAPIDPATGAPFSVADEDPSNYTGASLEPGIGIEKDTNGVQSDEAPGEEIAFGDAVVWTYVVTNTGGTALANATVTDNTGVIVDCDIDGDGTPDGTNVIPFLAFGASVTCYGEGTAQVGPYENIGDVTGDPIRPDFATCGCDPLDPATWPTDPAGYVPALDDSGAPLGPVDDADASHYTGTATFDLALEKTIADGQDVSNLAIGDDVTYTIEVFNQGTVDASDISLIDYTPAALEVNDPAWTIDADGNATIDLTGVTLAPGESTTVDITMTILEAGDINNTAEITNSTAVDANGDPILGPEGEPLADVDSIADALDTDVLSDGVTDGTDGDEDDHDIASITVAAPAPPVPEPVIPILAFTGAETWQLVLGATLALGAGMGLTLLGTRRKEDTVEA